MRRIMLIFVENLFNLIDFRDTCFGILDRIGQEKGWSSESCLSHKLCRRLQLI